MVENNQAAADDFGRRAFCRLFAWRSGGYWIRAFLG
jgi:hypothetical protein